MKRLGIVLLSVGLIAALVAAYAHFRGGMDQSRRSGLVRQWILNPSAHTEWAIHAGTRCGNAPFLLPTDGFIGYLWGDTFQANHPHQGIDLFSGTRAGETPVYAAYDGYLTRMSSWKSTIAIRIPSNPLHPGEQIWTYYTHMADADGTSTISPDFPPGTTEVVVSAGTLLGWQGNFSGTPGSPVGVHLHFPSYGMTAREKLPTKRSLLTPMTHRPSSGWTLTPAQQVLQSSAALSETMQ